MTRTLAILALAAGLASAQPPAPPQEPPEEDASLIPKEYAFNPIQAAREIQVGGFYFKKGNYKAAALRFEEATKWNPQLADAWHRLGEARDKVAEGTRLAKRFDVLERDREAARQAWLKFLELAPQDKRAAAVRRKLGSKP